MIIEPTTDLSALIERLKAARAKNPQLAHLPFISLDETIQAMELMNEKDVMIGLLRLKAEILQRQIEQERAARGSVDKEVISMRPASQSPGLNLPGELK